MKINDQIDFFFDKLEDQNVILAKKLNTSSLT